MLSARVLELGLRLGLAVAAQVCQVRRAGGGIVYEPASDAGP